MTAAFVNRIATAVPPQEVHGAFVGFARQMLTSDKERRLFDKMVERAGISQRYSFLTPEVLPDGTITDTERFYDAGDWPTTGARMAKYEDWAPKLALEAIGKLDLPEGGGEITHLVVASCTGFSAPGLDQLIVAGSGIRPSVERFVLGYMGCYAAVNTLRMAHHIVRSDPGARVLAVNLELCTLHLQQTDRLERLLSMLLFGDGASAALVTADPQGLELRDFRSAAIAGSADAITWTIGETGFDMHLDGKVPGFIAGALSEERAVAGADDLFRGDDPTGYDLYAVHAGGRSILDAVERALDLRDNALEHSRGVLHDFGNMSSATLMFVLQRILAGPASGDGLAMAFGPGLAAESFRFRKA